jgi:hypothetical protein
MHDRFERAGLPDCLPEAKEAPVVVDLAAAPGSSASGGVDDPLAQDAPERDDATLANGRCVQDARAFFDDHQNVIFVGLLLLVLPMLAGMFWGAPLVAREVEHGTHRLVWTQGVSRLRWATTKIGLVSVAVLSASACSWAPSTGYGAESPDRRGQRWAPMSSGRMVRPTSWPPSTSHLASRDDGNDGKRKP